MITGLLSVPSTATLLTLKKSIEQRGNVCPLTQKHLVQLDWVSKEDGSHILTVGVWIIWNNSLRVGSYYEFTSHRSDTAFSCTLLFQTQPLRRDLIATNRLEVRKRCLSSRLPLQPPVWVKKMLRSGGCVSGPWSYGQRTDYRLYPCIYPGSVMVYSSSVWTTKCKFIPNGKMLSTKIQTNRLLMIKMQGKKVDVFLSELALGSSPAMILR